MVTEPVVNGFYRMQILLAELELQPIGPKVILVDINGDLECFPALEKRLEANGGLMLVQMKQFGVPYPTWLRVASHSQADEKRLLHCE